MSPLVTENQLPSEISSPSDSFPRILPAIVGVGAALTAWVYLARCLITVITAVISYFVVNYEFDSLYRLFRGLDFWVVPPLFILGIFLLSLVQEESGAKSSFKLSWLLFLGHWTWLVVVMFEKNPDSIPASVHWIANLIGLAPPLSLFWGFLRLSKFCEDKQMRSWSRLGGSFCLVASLISGFRDGCDLFFPEFDHLLSDQQYEIYVQVLKCLYYAHWVVWVPLVYCMSRVLWRIIDHAEIEAQKKIPAPPLAAPPAEAQKVE